MYNFTAFNAYSKLIQNKIKKSPSPTKEENNLQLNDDENENHFDLLPDVECPATESDIDEIYEKFGMDYDFVKNTKRKVTLRSGAPAVSPSINPGRTIPPIVTQCSRRSQSVISVIPSGSPSSTDLSSPALINVPLTGEERESLISFV